MKKRLTKGEKLLFASPLLFLALAGAIWQWRSAKPVSLPIDNNTMIKAMEFSPDNKRLVIVFDDFKTKQHGGRVYDLESRSKVCDLATAYPVWFGENSEVPFWSKDGSLVASNAKLDYPVNPTTKTQNQISIWDATSGALKGKYRYDQPESQSLWGEVRFSENGKAFVGGGVPPAVYSVDSGKRVNKPDKNFEQNVEFSKLSPNGRWLATRTLSGDDYVETLQVVDFETRKPLWKPPIEHIASLEWHGDILNVVFSKLKNEKPKNYHRNRLLLWNAKTGQQLPAPTFPNNFSPVELHFDTDQSTISYGYYNSEEVEYKSEITMWDYRANRVRWQKRIDGQLINLQPSPNRKWLLALAAGGNLFTFFVFDRNGQIQFQREPSNYIATWSSDSQLAFQMMKKSGGTYSNYLEIHRFED